MNRYLYLEKISLFKKIIGNILWISGFFCLLLVNVRFGPGFLFVWGILFFAGLYFISTEGIELNFESNSYRQVFSIFGSNYGTWDYFPHIEYVSLFRTRVSQTIGGKSFSSTASATLSDKVIKINLFSPNRNHPTTLYVTKNENIAYEIAEKFKLFYGVEIVDKLKTDEN